MQKSRAHMIELVGCSSLNDQISGVQPRSRPGQPKADRLAQRLRQQLPNLDRDPTPEYNLGLGRTAPTLGALGLLQQGRLMVQMTYLLVCNLIFS